MQIYVKLLTGKTLTLEVEGSMTTEQLKAMIEAADGDFPAQEQCILVGAGEGTRLENGMTLADYKVQKEADLRLVPRQRPPPHESQTHMAEAMAQLAEAQVGLARRWDKHHDSVEALESRKLAASARHQSIDMRMLGRVAHDETQCRRGAVLQLPPVALCVRSFHVQAPQSLPNLSQTAELRH